MRRSLLRVLTGCAALVSSCASETTSITLSHLPERFEPVARFEDSLHFLDGWLCVRPLELSRDCTGGVFEGRLYFPGISLASAASTDGRVVGFYAVGVGKAGKGVTTSSISNYAFATIARVLREAGVAIVRPRPLTSPGQLYGYVLELDGDGYSALRAASAAAPIPPAPVTPTSPLERPTRNPLFIEVALLVKAPPTVMEEARDVDAITWLNCENVVVLVQSCSNWAGPLLLLAHGGAEATVAANRNGDVLLVGGSKGFAVKLAGNSDALNVSTGAVLDALRSQGVRIRRVRAAVIDPKGPAYAYLVELEGDGFSVLRDYAANAGEPPPAR